MNELAQADINAIQSDRRFRLGRLIGYASDMYSMLNNAMNALRCAGVGDTRYVLTTAHDIEQLLARIDGKENSHDRRTKTLPILWRDTKSHNTEYT